MPAFDEMLQVLINNIRRLLSKQSQINEQNTKSALIDPLLQSLGWSIHDIDEVQHEYRYKPKDSPVDYALCIAGVPKLFIEAKALGEDLGQDRWKKQAVNYANTSGVNWCVLTNGNIWQVFKSNAPEALDKKLFLETWLYSEKGRTPPFSPSYVFPLLGKTQLDGDEIETLWQKLNIDRRCREALLNLVKSKDSGLVRLIRKESGLSKKHIETFLERAAITIDTPHDDAIPQVLSPSTPEKPERGKRKPPLVKGLPSQSKIELPLLKAILARGGEIRAKINSKERSSMEATIAKQFRLTDEQQRITLAGSTQTVWSNRIGWTRMRLVTSGDIDNSRRGIWALTEQGRRRASEKD